MTTQPPEQDNVIIKRTGFKRILFTLVHSGNGVKWLVKNEAAFRQELVLFVPLTILACSLDLPTMQALLLVMVLVLILMMEMINTAIEAVVDRIGLEYHELSGVAKNVGSAVVTLSMIVAAVVWAIVLYPLFF